MPFLENTKTTICDCLGGMLLEARERCILGHLFTALLEPRFCNISWFPGVAPWTRLGGKLGHRKKRFACPTASPEEAQETNFFTFRKNRMRAGKSCFGGGRFRAAFRGVAFAMCPRFGGSHLIDLGHQSSQKWTSKTSCISNPSAPPRKHKNNDLRLSGGDAFGRIF